MCTVDLILLTSLLFSTSVLDPNRFWLQPFQVLWVSPQCSGAVSSGANPSPGSNPSLRLSPQDSSSWQQHPPRASRPGLVHPYRYWALKPGQPWELLSARDRIGPVRPLRGPTEAIAARETHSSGPGEPLDYCTQIQFWPWELGAKQCVCNTISLLMDMES